MILGLQIIALIFAFAMIYFALVNYKRGEIDKTEVVSWVVIWFAVIFIVIFPNLLREYSERLFITRLFDLMVVGGFILVIAMTTKTYVRIRKMEKKIEDLVRKDAIDKVSKKSNSIK